MIRARLASIYWLAWSRANRPYLGDTLIVRYHSVNSDRDVHHHHSHQLYTASRISRSGFLVQRKQ